MRLKPPKLPWISYCVVHLLLAMGPVLKCNLHIQ